LSLQGASAQVPNGQPPIRDAWQGVIYSIDGSAHLRTMTDDLRRAVAKANLPLQVEPVDWSHGSGRIFADLHGQAHHRAQGSDLGARIKARRQANPTERIYVVSHSAGAAVALAAADGLPSDALERVILLAPAVSATYDLRPALRSARAGIDVFFSRKDLISLSLNVIGTTDGRHASAGINGFDVIPEEADRPLYAKLRQFSWNSSMSRSGNYGGHFGFTRLGFFEASIVPLLSQGPSAPGLTSNEKQQSAD
jgi:pimeloyl-ACP methyl ester carboxylesterase